MIKENENPDYKKWLRFNTWALLLIMLASAAAPVAPYNWDGFYSFPYKVLSVILITAFIYFNFKTVQLEAKLVIGYCCWLIISRILNGDMLLSQDGIMVMDICVSCMMLTILLLNDKDKRLRIMDFAAVALVALFTVGAVFGIYTAITQNYFINPLSEWYLINIVSGRLCIFDSNPNVGGYWVMTAVLLSGYLFMRHKNWAVRIICILTAGLNFVALALTASRNVMLGFSVSAAAFAVLLVLKYSNFKKLWQKTVIVVLALGLVAPLCYVSFGYTARAVGRAAARHETKIIEEQLRQEKEEEEEKESFNDSENAAEEEARIQEQIPLPEPEEAENIYDDKRGFEDSGRLPIYKQAFQNFAEEPLRLIRGCMDDELFTTEAALRHQEECGHAIGHYHNSFIQALELTGIPGLLFAAAFWILLIIHSFRLFFTDSPEASIAIKFLVVFLPAIFVNNLLETSSFCIMDYRANFFFLIAGAVIAYSYEICPPKRKSR